MGVPAEAPQAVHDYWNSIPQDNYGEFYFKVRAPFMPFGTWRKLEAWGQLCDGTDNAMMVACQLWNKFPNRGRGWKYVAWRAEPYNPELCKYPRSGVVDPPKFRRNSGAYSFDCGVATPSNR